MVLNLQIHNKLFIYLVNISYVMHVHVGSVGVVCQLSTETAVYDFYSRVVFIFVREHLILEMYMVCVYT